MPSVKLKFVGGVVWHEPGAAKGYHLICKCVCVSVCDLQKLCPAVNIFLAPVNTHIHTHTHRGLQGKFAHSFALAT